MPLSVSAKRELIHHRSIQCKGYQRKDGLWDIEGHLVDTKTYELENHDRGGIPAGEALHDMWLRITVDNDLLIKGAEAVIDASPYNMCPQITDNFKKLVGIQIKHGWRRKVNQVVGGTAGCTHLVELLNPLASTAFQTLYKIKKEQLISDQQINKPILLKTCHTFASGSPIVKRQWPDYYEGE